MVDLALPADKALNWGQPLRMAFAILSAAIDVLAPKPARVFYVNPVTGNDAAVGSVGSPLRTVGEAVKRAEESAQQRATDVTIILAAGTYGSTQRVRFTGYTWHNLNVVIKGPDVGGHPNVPTAIFTESLNASATAIFNPNPNATVTVQDVKMVGYRGTTSSNAILNYGGKLFCVNVHADDCYYGVSSQMGDLDVKGGIFDRIGRLQTGTGTGSCVRSLQLNRHAIGTQNAGTLDNGPIFRNSYVGVFAQESSTGHVDWCRFEDNSNGVIARVNARINCDGSDFRRNGAAITTDANGHVFISDNVTFGTGADANISSSVINRSGGNLTTTRMIANGATGVEMAYSRVEQAGEGIYTAQTITGTTAVADIYARTLKAPFWGDGPQATRPVDRVRIRARGRFTGTGAKELHLRLGDQVAALQFSTSAAELAGDFTAHGEVIFAEPDRQIIGIDGYTNGGRFLTDNVEVDVDLTVDQPFRFTGRLATAADSIVVTWVEMSWA